MPHDRSANARVIDFATARSRRRPQLEPWVTKREVAEHFSVSIRTVTRWMYPPPGSGRTPMPFDPGPWEGAHPRFRISEIEAWRRGETPR